MFFKWAKFCMKNQDNPFLPKFFGYESFVWNNHNYLQIRQEKLTKSGNFGLFIESLADECTECSTYTEVINVIQEDLFSELLPALQRKLSDKEIKVLIKTILALQAIGDKQGWDWDLHGGNVMMRGKTPVIVDPWVV